MTLCTPDNDRYRASKRIQSLGGFATGGGIQTFIYAWAFVIRSVEYFYRLWQMYPVLVDMALYFFVFGAAARVAFAKSFPGHEGKALSIAVGLFLAAALAMAQRKLGFSTANLGPVAVFILCGVVFLASYKFIHQSDVSKPVTVLLSALIAFALARAAMPNLVGSFVKRNPITIVLVVGGLLYWAWQSSGMYANRIRKGLPGNTLAQNRVIPNDDTLHKEKQFVKKRLRDGTRANTKDEKVVEGGLEKAQQLLQNGDLSADKRRRVEGLLQEAVARAHKMRERTARLFQLDGALRKFDLQWFKRTHAIDLSRLTPAQQNVARQSLLDERKRVLAEEELGKLEGQLNQQMATLESCVTRAKEGIAGNDPAAAAGWIGEALKCEKALRKVEDDALAWEKRILALVKRQIQELSQPA